MGTPLNLLVIENQEENCLLFIDNLKQGGFAPTWKQITSEPALTDALDNQDWDIVIACYSMPDIDIMQALHMVKKQNRDIPFIIMSDHVHEEDAIRAMSAGAQDYIMKDNLARLVPVVLRELKETKIRTSYRKTMNSLQASDNRFRTLVESMEDTVFTLDREQRYTSLFGRSLDKSPLNPINCLGKTAYEIYDDTTAHIHHEANERALHGENVLYDWISETAEGTNLFQTSLSPLVDQNGEISGIVGINRDITQYRLAETRRKEQEAIILQSPIVVFLKNADENLAVVYVSDNVEHQFGYSTQDFENGLSFASIIYPTDLERIKAEIIDADFNSNLPVTLEYRLITKDRQIRYVEERLLARRNTQGHISHYQGILIDITDRRKAEEELRQSEEKYRRLFEDAILGIFQSTIEGKFIHVNQAYTQMFGYASPDEIISNIQAEDVFETPEDRHLIIEKIMASDGTIQMENHYRRKDGSVFIGNLYAWAVRLSDHQIDHIEGFIEDITERIKTEQALRNSETKYRSLIENLKEGIYLSDENGSIIEWNHAMEMVTGISREEALNQPAWDIQSSLTKEVHNPTIQQIYKKYAMEILENGGTPQTSSYMENSFIRRDGVERIMETLVFPIKTEKGTMVGSIVRDVTERKLTEEILKLREEEFRALAENAPDGIQRLDREYRYIYANPAMQHIFDIEPADITGSYLFDMGMTEEAEETWLDALKDVFEHQKEMTIEVTHPCDDGLRFYQTRIVPETTVKGSTHTVLCVTRDVTDLKQTQQALQRSEEQYRNMVENINEVIFNLDANNLITYISPAVTFILGYQPDEMLGKPFVRFVHPNDVSSLGINFSRSLMAKIAPFEFRMIDKNGTAHDLSISTNPRHENDIFLGLSGIITDLTERKRMNKALADSQKMVDIGTLTAGVAHEIKSPLAVITGISETIIQQLMENNFDIDNTIQQLETVKRSGWRIANIASSLLNYARATEGDIELNDINEIITDTLLLVEHQLASWSNVFVTTDLGEHLPRFACDRNKITQVLINLMTNARDAMAEGGEINILTRFDTHTNRLVLKVSDTGQGIPEEIQKHIFEPFYTTKPAGAGTGLGLHIISEIIHNHGGTIEIESTSAAGTTFCIRFPLTHLQKKTHPGEYTLFLNTN